MPLGGRTRRAISTDSRARTKIDECGGTSLPPSAWPGAVLTVLGRCGAATYHVSTSGNDSNSGTQSAPLQHLSKGAAAATQPGDTVIVIDGAYDNAPNYVVTLYCSGASGNPITFQAQPRGMAILDSMNTSTTTTCNGAYSYFNLYNASFIVIQGFVIDQGPGIADIQQARCGTDSRHPEAWAEVCQERAV